jgi:preprotein translocase subunit SecB
MSKPSNAQIQFVNFLVLDSKIAIKDRGNFELAFDFYKPSGTYLKDLGQFMLYLNLRIKEKNNLLSIDIKTVSFFQVEDTEYETLKKFFTYNCPAIVFPYIRSFISTISAQSGFGTITIPTMNLLPLSTKLEKNLTINE